MKTALRTLFVLTLVLASFHAASTAQTQPQPARQESQTMKLLTLKKAQLNLEKTKGDFERSLKLKEQGLTSEEDFARIQTAYLQAQVDYQQALINFMGSEARISWPARSSSRTPAGKKFVRVTLRYSSKELKELGRLNINAEDLFPLDFMKEIKDVSVSLRSEGKIISDPYEKTISSLAPGDGTGRDLPAAQGRREPRHQRLLFGQGRNDARSISRRA